MARQLTAGSAYLAERVAIGDGDTPASVVINEGEVGSHIGWVSSVLDSRSQDASVRGGLASFLISRGRYLEVRKLMIRLTGHYFPQPNNS